MHHLTLLHPTNIRLSHTYLFVILILASSCQVKDRYVQKKDLHTTEKNTTKTKNDSLKVIQMIDLSRTIHSQNHNTTKEYKYARKAIDLSLKTKDTLLYARALDNLGLLYRYHQWYLQAIPLHIKAFTLTENKKIPPLYKMIFANNAGVAARYNQQYDLAVSYYLKALKIANKNNNLKNIAISSNGLGNALGNIKGKEEEALSYFTKALRIERQLKDSLGMAMDLLSISDYYIQKEAFTKARRYLDTLYRINNKRQDLYGIAITNEFYGHAYYKEGTTLKKAQIYYLKSLRQFKKLNDKNKKAELLKSLGDLNLKMGKSNTALHYYNNSITLADSIQNKGLIVQNAYNISTIKEQQNKYFEALFYFKKANKYKDSIAISRQKTKITALTNQYKIEKKESKIASLQKVNLLRENRITAQEQKIVKHRLYFIFLLAGIIIIALFILLQYRNRKIKKRAEKLLRKKQKEIRTAKYEKSIAQAELLAARAQLNPHFIFNSLNAIHLLMQQGQLKKADQYLIKLSRFIRMVLELPKSNSIPLTDELKLISYYVALEEKRFGNEFIYQLHSLPEEEMKKIMIPPLLLQPLVENAIWHGLLPSEKKQKILKIGISKIKEGIKISLSDNGVGCNNCKYQPNINLKKTKSLGSQITKERIKQ